MDVARPVRVGELTRSCVAHPLAQAIVELGEAVKRSGAWSPAVVSNWMRRWPTLAYDLVGAAERHVENEAPSAVPTSTS
jgi:hypothetical protein